MKKRYLIAIGNNPMDLENEVEELLNIDPGYIPAGGVCKVSDTTYIQAMFYPLNIDKPIQLFYQATNPPGSV